MGQRRPLFWFILIRVVVVSLFLVSTIALNAKEPESVAVATLSGLVKLIVATYLFSICSLLVLKFTGRFRQTLTYAQIVWDLSLVTLLLLLTGGIESPYSFLYIISIINASVLLARREAVYTAALCGILYGAIIDLQFYGKLATLGLNPLAAGQHSTGHILYTLFINISTYFLTAFLTGYLAERAIRSESALQEKVIDYEELERLNSLIVSNIDTGLVTLNSVGRIRVLNPYAERLLGVSQKTAYDRPLTDLLPNFNPLGEGSCDALRGEIEYLRDGHAVILGVKAISLADNEASAADILVELQDLTQIRQMETELKRTDRLAAIGELSARIAHEIRNPLASISGSVQLIAEGDKVVAGDRKLLSIVLRETDRLNALITDFLSYARPGQAVRSSVPLRQLVDDLAAQLEGDARFRNVVVTNDCPAGLMICADRDQMHQVFMNLVFNAVDAMRGGGTIVLAADGASGAGGRRAHAGMVRIEVRDSGHGMSAAEKSKVFEPFFTTKSGGTGLGLATVYRIVESHGGKVSIESEVGRGTVVTLLIPAGLED
jgi:two-component system, NtrC family, sensor histidine kinase PilS